MAFRWTKKKQTKRARQPMSRGMVRAVSVAFLLAGLVPTAVYGTRLVQEAHARLTWRGVECEIVEVRHDDAAGRFNRRQLYRPHVAYRYTFDGATHTSDGIYLRPFRTSARGAAKLLKAYPIGSWHTCYVDPTDSSRAALRPINPGSIGWVAVAAPWVLIGAVSLLRAVRTR